MLSLGHFRSKKLTSHYRFIWLSHQDRSDEAVISPQENFYSPMKMHVKLCSELFLKPAHNLAFIQGGPETRNGRSPARY
jgi:hypothetical protein